MTGVACQSGDCQVHLHPFCYALIKQQPHPLCPGCRSSFNDVVPSPIGEESVRREEDDFVRLQRKRKRAGKGNETIEDEEDEEDEEAEPEDEDGAESQNQPGPSQVPAAVGVGPAKWVATGRTGQNGPMGSRRVPRGTVVPETQEQDD